MGEGRVPQQAMPKIKYPKIIIEIIGDNPIVHY
jgi:hypothetical protein